MRIGVTSQNFRTITGHAGKSRRFLLFEQDSAGVLHESGRLDLPLTLSLHAFGGDDHPLFTLDALITESCGAGFIQRLAHHGVQVITTSASDPLAAATAFVSGQTLPAPVPHEHTHDEAHGPGQSPGSINVTWHRSK